jgi:colanic acid/amylovoran biosynthesis glycosyltransferase
VAVHRRALVEGTLHNPANVMRKPHIAFYSSIYLPRSENFLYNQLTGLPHAVTSVVAVSGANLSEFPADRLFLAQPTRGSVAWMIDGAWRRLKRDSGAKHKLARTFARRIHRHLEKTRPDLVYCMFGWHACQVMDVLDSLSFGVPLVFHGAGTDVTAAASFGEAYVSSLRRVFDRAKIILCGSQFLRRRLLDIGAPDEKVRVHYLGVEVPAPISKPVGSRFTVLAVSRLVPVKGVSHTIEAFAAAVPRMPGAVLDIIGDGPCRDECIALAQRLGVGDQVRFCGEQPQDVVFDAMRRADVFVQHNVRSPEGQEEGLGGTIIEASARLLPVVVTNSGGIPEAVRDGETGFVGAPGDVPAMAEALVALHDRPELRARFGAAGHALIDAEFNIRRQNERLERFLLEACG